MVGQTLKAVPSFNLKQHYDMKAKDKFSRPLTVGQTLAPEPSHISTVEIMRFDIYPQKYTFWSSIKKINILVINPQNIDNLIKLTFIWF